MMHIDENAGIPIYKQIFNYFIAEIQAGRYAVGNKLPSIRVLCRELNVSKSTVENAYSLLLSEGYVESARGSGYIVSSLDRLPAEKQLQRQLPKSRKRKIYNFEAGVLNDDVFPLTLWRKLTNQALTHPEKINSYTDKQGEYELREEVARYLYLSREMHCKPEQIVMTNSLQQSVEDIIKLIDRGNIAAVEEPGFSSVRRVFLNNKYKIAPIPVEDDGLSVEAIQNSDAGVVFTTPSHQMPTGAVLP